MAARLRAIVALVILIFAGAFAGVSTATPVSAITCSHGIITLYDGLNATGAARSFCNDDYPLANSAACFGGACATVYFTGTTIPMDNHVESIRYDPTTPAGYRQRYFTGYNFNDSSERPGYPNPPPYLELVKSSGETIENLPTGWRNKVSSFLGCGSTCSDDPT